VLVRSPRRRREWCLLADRHGATLTVGVVGNLAAWDVIPPGTDPEDIDTMVVPRTREALAADERALRRSIVKPTDGRVARVNRRLSIPVSVFLIRWLRLGPNAMSLFVLALGLLAGWLFARGDYASGVAAAAISLAAGILDGCDGELARLQYRQSAFGCWLDTLGDYAYYVTTFVGLTIGVVRATGHAAYGWIGAVLLAGMGLTFVLLIVLRHRLTRGRPELLHATAKAHFEAGNRWARLAVRLAISATRATMPYGILVFAVIGQLPIVLGLAAVGANVYWISLAIELRRLLAGARESLPAATLAGPGATAAAPVTSR
jgi:phosphatidylglycerophosphate synthase